MLNKLQGFGECEDAKRETMKQLKKHGHKEGSHGRHKKKNSALKCSRADPSLNIWLSFISNQMQREIYGTPSRACKPICKEWP